MGHVADWNRQDHKKGASTGKVTVRKFSEGGPVTEDTRERAAGASYDSITDFMDYVRGRGKYGTRNDGGYTRTDSKGVRENELPEDPIVPATSAVSAAPEPTNQDAPEDGNVGGPRQESAPRPAAAKLASRQRARVIRAASAPAAVKPAAPPVTPVATPAPAAPSAPVGGPMAPPSLQSAPSTAMSVSAESPYGKSVSDRIAASRSDKPLAARVLDKLASQRPYVGAYKDGGLVSDSNWTRGNFKKSGC